MDELVPVSREHLLLGQGSAVSILQTHQSRAWAGHWALSLHAGGEEPTGWLPSGSLRIVLLL